MRLQLLRFLLLLATHESLAFADQSRRIIHPRAGCLRDRTKLWYGYPEVVQQQSYGDGVNLVDGVIHATLQRRCELADAIDRYSSQM